MRVLLVISAALIGSLGQPVYAQDDFEGLAASPGQEEVFYRCSGCHSTQIIQQQGLTRQRWDTLLDWMVEEMGMPEIEAEIEPVVLDYLAREYGPDRPNWRRPGG